MIRAIHTSMTNFAKVDEILARERAARLSSVLMTGDYTWRDWTVQAESLGRASARLLMVLAALEHDAQDTIREAMDGETARIARALAIDAAHAAHMAFDGMEEEVNFIHSRAASEGIHDARD